MVASQTQSPDPERNSTLTDRWAAWLGGRRPVSTGFRLPPEPRSIGMIAKGRQLIAGNIHLGGQVIEAPGKSLWDILPSDHHAIEAAHGFLWADDLAAAGNLAAWTLAQRWCFDWIARYGQGKGPGWTPALTGRRLLRWINHAQMLLSNCPAADNARFFQSISRQIHYLARRWKSAPLGLARFEALSGLICASLALDGMEHLLAPALQALSQDCTTQIDTEGAIPSRNPEELLEIFTLLTLVSHALAQAQRSELPALQRAIQQMAPTLRALRHGDGGLARFHEGDRGPEGRLDHALGLSQIKPSAHPAHMAMGYIRLSGGRSTLILDGASPPMGQAERSAHASTLAFELTSGRRPLIVSCGSGAPFGPDWHRAGRATASHSTLALDGSSSSRLGHGDRLTDRAPVIPAQISFGPEGQTLLIGHQGWSTSHGLTHMRSLELSVDGRALMGKDTLAAFTAPERQSFEAAMVANLRQGIPFTIRFHLHPEVDAQIDMGGTAVSLALRSGEIWVFRHDGMANMALEPSVYLEKGRLKPRASKQIVLSARVLDYAAEVGWTLAKAQDTPLAIRDLERDDVPV